MSNGKIWSAVALGCTVWLAGQTAHAATFVAGFEDFPLAADSYYIGDDGVGSFTSGGATFNIDYDTEWGSWSGFAPTNIKNVAVGGWLNQWAVYDVPGQADGAGHNSPTAAVVFGTSPGVAKVTLPNNSQLVSMKVTNTTYAALTMVTGDPFSKKFGDNPLTDDVIEDDFPDWFLLTIIGLDAVGNQLGTVPFYLADFRADDSAADYIVDSWTTVDLSSLVGATQLTFALTSSDNGSFGMNTPGYFAIDDLTFEVVPEPTSLALAACGAAALVWVARRRRATCSSAGTAL